VLSRDHNRKIDERRKYVNLFDGLDNTKMYDFEQLRRATFRDIFSCKNKNAVSIKKTINYLNYSNEVTDIISK
jgi:hypothetical protein